MNILVPTDFSETSKAAYIYAQELALYLEANIKVVHVHHPSFDASNPYMVIPDDAFQESKRGLLNEFVNNPTHQEIADVITEEMVDKELLLGFATEQIVRLSATDEIDMIVMGTTGSSGLLEKLFGSVSSHVAQNAHCPVILVPKGASFKDFRNVLYASNYESADDVLLREIADFAALFSAGIHLVHVNETNKKGDYEFEELILEQLFRKKAPNLEFKMLTVQSASAWEGLNRYARENEVDLIVLATRHRKFWEKLVHKSITKKMMMGAQLPIMVLPIEN